MVSCLQRGSSGRQCKSESHSIGRYRRGIIAGTIDLGISFTPPLNDDLQRQELFRDEIVLVASPKSFPLDKIFAPDDFAALRIALPSARISATRLLSRYIDEHQLGVAQNIRMSFDDGHALIEFVKKGKFVTLLPRQCVKEDAEICVYSIPKPGVEVGVGAVWSHLTPAAKVFLDLAIEMSKNLVL